jgi:hypothetical protein
VSCIFDQKQKRRKIVFKTMKVETEPNDSDTSESLPVREGKNEQINKQFVCKPSNDSSEVIEKVREREREYDVRRVWVTRERVNEESME